MVLGWVQLYEPPLQAPTTLYATPLRPNNPVSQSQENSPQNERIPAFDSNSIRPDWIESAESRGAFSTRTTVDGVICSLQNSFSKWSISLIGIECIVLECKLGLKLIYRA